MNIISYFVLALSLLAVFIIGNFYYNKKQIVFELDKRYYKLNDLRNAALKYLESQGKKCSVLDSTTLLVDGQKYTLTERTINVYAPVQQVILVKEFKHKLHKNLWNIK